MELLLSTGQFDAKLLLGILPLLHEAGFRHLEMSDSYHFDNTSLDDVSRKAADCGITMPNWHLAGGSPFQATEKERNASIDSMKQSMDRGAQIGAQNHVLHWLNRFLDNKYDDLWREIIDEWTSHAKSLGIRLLMETIPDKPQNERYVPTSEIFEFVREYPAEVLSICIDVNHSNLKENLADVVTEADDRLISLHISDNDGNLEQHWLPGQGVIDFPLLFESFTSVGFDGLIVIEVAPWCEDSSSQANLSRLHEFGMSLLETGKPHPKTPPLKER